MTKKPGAPMPILKKKAARIVQRLRDRYPEAVCTLRHEDPWQLLIATILSAQCTDARVNQITPALFKRYPTVDKMAEAQRPDVEALIHSCGLYRNKARAIVQTSRLLQEKHNGHVPDQLNLLTDLPGVGRKTANLILGDAFGQPAIVVDTHCARISRLLGLTDATDPLHVERDLQALLTSETWIDYGHLMVTHGREVCVARNPGCDRCCLNMLCRYALENEQALDHSTA
jgi:endonuclease III